MVVFHDFTLSMEFRKQTVSLVQPYQTITLTSWGLLETKKISWFWITNPHSVFAPIDKSRNIFLVMQYIQSLPVISFTSRLIDQSHRYGRPQAACREPAESYDKTTRTAICFEHKTQYLLIRAPYTRIVVFWHISNIPPPPWFRRVKIVVIPPRFI